MRILLKDGFDNTLKVVSALEFTYDPEEETIDILMGDGETYIIIPNVHPFEYKGYVMKLYEYGKLDLSDKESFYEDEYEEYIQD